MTSHSIINTHHTHPSSHIHLNSPRNFRNFLLISKQFKESRTRTISQPSSKKQLAKPCRSNPDNLNKENYEQLREETFQKWLESKKEEQKRKCEEEKREKKRLLEQEEMKKEAAELSYLLWKYNKDQQKKAKEEKELKQKKEEENQKKLRQKESKERVVQWMQTSKLKPKPVPSGMGLLSLTGTNPPSFFNPRPWVHPV